MQQKQNMGIKLLFLSFFISVSAFSQTGIGTTTPAVKLHVKSNGATFRLEGTDHVFMELFPQGSATRYAYFGFPGAVSNNLTMMNNSASGSVVLGTNNSSRLIIDNAGNTSMTGNLLGNNSATSTIANFSSVINDQTAGFTLGNGDNGKIIVINSSSATTITVPSLSVGFNCMIVQRGTGQVTIAASGVTINNRYSFNKTAGQHSILTLVCIASGIYISSGDMTN
jgi:hypothetical protein